MRSFKVSWKSGYWPLFHSDGGKLIGNRNIALKAEIIDGTNNSPTGLAHKNNFIYDLKFFSVLHHRPIWTVKARCPEQTLDLNPTDPEGDQIICRWASKDEASG